MVNAYQVKAEIKAYQCMRTFPFTEISELH